MSQPGRAPLNNGQPLRTEAIATAYCACGLPPRPFHPSGHLIWWWWPALDPQPRTVVRAVAWRGDEEPDERCWRRSPDGAFWELSGSKVSHQLRRAWSAVGTCALGNQHPVIEVDE